MNFKIGDKVKFNLEDESRLSDYESDLMADFEERSITGAKFDAISEAIEQEKTWTVVRLNEEGGCELKLDGTEIEFPYVLEHPDIIPA